MINGIWAFKAGQAQDTLINGGNGQFHFFARKVYTLSLDRQGQGLTGDHRFGGINGDFGTTSVMINVKPGQSHGPDGQFGNFSGIRTEGGYGQISTGSPVLIYQHVNFTSFGRQVDILRQAYLIIDHHDDGFARKWGFDKGF